MLKDVGKFIKTHLKVLGEMFITMWIGGSIFSIVTHFLNPSASVVSLLVVTFLAPFIVLGLDILLAGIATKICKAIDE